MSKRYVISCFKHQSFFDDRCELCKKEYFLIKGLEKNGKIILDKHTCISPPLKQSQYKEFTEDKAKILYEKLFLYYLKNFKDEKNASEMAKTIIRKQCKIRNIEVWDWT